MIRRPAVPLAVLLLALPAAGCTATIATLRLVEADRAVRDAADAGAEANAPYEYTLAVRHLEEAIATSAVSEFKSTHQLARTATTWALEAKNVAQGGVRGADKINTDDLTDEVRPDPLGGDGTPSPTRTPSTSPSSDEPSGDLLELEEDDL